jgi:hypothetical protein
MELPRNPFIFGASALGHHSIDAMQIQYVLAGQNYEFS